MKLTVKKRKVSDMQNEVRTDRQAFIGGSEAGTILGMNPYESRYTLWAKKTGLITDEIPDNDAMKTGRDLENYVAQRFMEATGKKVVHDNTRYSLKEYPWMVGHIDRRVVGEKAGLECKTANSFQNKEYAAGNFPDHYYAQCQHYMAVTGADHWYLGVLCFPHFYWTEFKRDEAEIEALISAEEEFWNLCIEGVAPEVDGSDSTTETISKAYRSVEDGTSEDRAVILPETHDLSIYFDAKEQIKALEEVTKGTENALKAALGEATRGILQDYAITWTPTKTNRIDTARLKAEQPDIYKQYLKETESRRFAIKKIKRKEIEE